MFSRLMCLAVSMHACEAGYGATAARTRLHRRADDRAASGNLRRTAQSASAHTWSRATDWSAPPQSQERCLAVSACRAPSSRLPPNLRSALSTSSPLVSCCDLLSCDAAGTGHMTVAGASPRGRPACGIDLWNRLARSTGGIGRPDRSVRGPVESGPRAICSVTIKTGRLLPIQ